ncbi:response regulator receiver sensor signal transduction histidine kinase [Candidatus Vecturithrix granuli]|uniref:histidine kinase n=1 Tax=Vecturithrix granuli TaxID=1499967 RepID=A0A0S6W9A7_VECG1|nr:response regulator receiver sensor signal transduction histidine kinase [Candidatus Vecturithrix granuli]
MFSTQESKSVILLVDDDPDNLHVLLEALDESRFRTLVALDGESALRQIDYIQPDLILLDVMLPGIDGFETCLRIKQHEEYKNIPVIFMTALAETISKVRGFQVGGVDYITKPVDVAEVLVRVDTHLTIRRLQKQLEEKNTQLKATNASKDLFFSIIAHDLRNALIGFLSFTEILENIELLGKDEFRTYSKLFRNSAETLFALLENLLTWSRLNRNMIEYCPQPLDVRMIFMRTLELFHSQADTKQIVLKHSTQEDIEVCADYNMLHTVMRNLVSNAIKFTEPQGVIEMSAISDEHEATISIADTGIGIPSEKIEKLFQIDEKFQRDGTAGEKGTGLGLILCKEFIEKHNGRIWVESKEGKGTTFRFTLPKA